MNIAVVFGGMSSERDVSIASGAQIFKALKSAGHSVIAVDTASGILNSNEEIDFLHAKVRETPPVTGKLSLMKNGIDKFIQSGRHKDIDICFLALHGGSGEDGTIQGYLDIQGIAYTGSSHMPCCYAMDKDVAKTLFRKKNVKTPDWLMTPADENQVEKELGFPVVVKPNREGSTVGLTVVKTKKDLIPAIIEAEKYDKEVMIEKYIPGRELTVGILADMPLGIGEIIPKYSEIFDYKSKYQKGGAEEIFPAQLSENDSVLVREAALAAHKALKLEDYSRADFRMDPEGNIWCLEVNTLPGMTATSLLPQSAAVCGISFPSLCEKICSLAMERERKERG